MVKNLVASADLSKIEVLTRLMGFLRLAWNFFASMEFLLESNLLNYTEPF